MATVYGVLMEFNVVFTLFYATTLVCLGRGVGWWVAHYWTRNRQRRAAGIDTVLVRTMRQT